MTVAAWCSGEPAPGQLASVAVRGIPGGPFQEAGVQRCKFPFADVSDYDARARETIRTGVPFTYTPVGPDHPSVQEQRRRVILPYRKCGPYPICPGRGDKMAV